MAFALAEQRDQHVGAADLVAARRLHMDRGTLNDSLEACGGLRVTRPVGRQPGQILVQEFGQVVA